VTRRVPFLLTGALALLLAWILAPSARAPRGAPSGSPVIAPVQAGLGLTETHVAIRPLVIGRRRPSAPTRSAPLGPRVEVGRITEADDEGGEIPMGFITGHVVDESGFPVKHAIVHLQGAEGTVAHRTDEDGTFHVAVPEGDWSAEAGWFDGDKEWRSKPTSAAVEAGEAVSLPFEILMGGAAHGVHSPLEENLGVGWEVASDDGPLRAGDVLVEVDGFLLADLQPESVEATLRSRPGETISALVLRRDASGDYEEVSVLLDAR